MNEAGTSERQICGLGSDLEFRVRAGNLGRSSFGHDHQSEGTWVIRREDRVTCISGNSNEIKIR